MAFGVFALILASLCLIYSLMWSKTAFGRDVLTFVSKHILWIGFFFSLAAIASSLTYSNYIGYAPCLLCWYARIALYPQALLYGMAIMKKKRDILDYSLLLTGFAIVVSAYHTIIENVGYSLIPCSTDGASCLARPVHMYGFITIPVMALAGSIALFLSILAAKRGSKINTETIS